MAGELRASAVCPVCGDDLIMITDTSDQTGVIREYYHAKGSPKARRKRRCLRIFTDHAEAARERKGLEVESYIGRRPLRMNCKRKGRANG